MSQSPFVVTSNIQGPEHVAWLVERAAPAIAELLAAHEETVAQRAQAEGAAEEAVCNTDAA